VDSCPNSIRLSDEANELISHFKTLDILSAPTVEPALLAPLATKGDFINISGPETWITADIAMAALYPARGGCALGELLKFDLDRLGTCNIAIIDADNNYIRWVSLLKRKFCAKGIDPAEATKNHIVSIWASDMELQTSKNWESQSKYGAEALARSQIKFIIGDTIARIWSPADINSAAWIQQGFAPFREACQQYGTSGLMLTHVSKGSQDQAGKSTSPIPIIHKFPLLVRQLSSLIVVDCNGYDQIFNMLSAFSGGISRCELQSSR